MFLRQSSGNRLKLFAPAHFYRSSLAIALPIMLQQLIQNLVTLIDNFMVSGLGDISMSGVQVSGQVLFIFMIFVNTICMSGGIFMTQFFGARDREGMQQAFRFKLAMGLAAALPYYLVCLGFPREVLHLMVRNNDQAELILDEGVKYIRIMFYMGLPMTFSMCIASSLREMGQVKYPLYVTVAATATNTLLNWLLIYGNLGFPAMGVEGAAIASVVARIVEFIIFAFIYVRVKPEFAINPLRLFKIDGKLFRDILRKGSLVLFCEMVWVLSETITTATYNGRGGADVVSGMGSSFTIANLFFVAFGGIYNATGVIMGKTLGEGNLEKARQEKTWILSGSAVFGFIMMIFGFATTLLIPVVFSRLSVNAVSISRKMVILMALFMPVWIYLNSQQAVSRAGGDAEMGAYTDATITIFIMIPMVLLLGAYTSVGPVTMYLYVKLLDFAKIIVFHFWLKKERWLKNITVIR